MYILLVYQYYFQREIQPLMADILTNELLGKLGEHGSVVVCKLWNSSQRTFSRI